MSKLATEYEYIDIELTGTSASERTNVWNVYTKPDRGHVILGEIRWLGRWRQYVFFPAYDTIYSAGCLEDIATFIKQVR